MSAPRRRPGAPGATRSIAPALVGLLASLAAAPVLAGSIEGTVREAGTRRPIPGAVVVVRGSDVEAITDDQGAYVLEFEAARGRAVTVEVSTSGYQTLVELVELRRDRPTTSRDLYLTPTSSGETRVRERRSKDNVARGAHVIEESEVNELPGTYGDPAKAIENFPGMGRVVLSQGSLFVRGAAPNESAVFVDDYEIPDLYHYTGSTSVINIPFVDSVELVPGAFSARYGRSIGGIVTLKTRKLPTDDVHGFAKLDVIDGGAYVGVPLGDKIAVGASARRSWLDVIRNTQKAIQGTGDDVVLTPTYWDWQLKLDWDTAPGHELVLFAFGSGDREEYLADGRGAIESFFETNDSDFGRVSLRYAHGIGSGFTHTLTPVVGYARNTLVEQGGVRFKQLDTLDVQLRDEVTYRGGPTRVIVGLDATARTDALTYGGLLADTQIREIEPIDLEAIAAGERVQQGAWRVTTALYSEGTFEPLEGVVLAPGVRAEALVIDGEPHVSLEPRFAGSWQLVPGDWGTMLKVGAGSFSRPPDADEVAAAAAYGVDLPPQRALHIQGGLEQRIGDRMFFSTTFFNIWRSELTTRSVRFPVPDRFGGVPVFAGGSGQSTGGEALLRVGVPKRYFAWLTYSLARHERFDGNGEGAVGYPYASPFDVTHLLGAVGQAHLPAGFRLGLRYRIATGMPQNSMAGAALDLDTGRYTPVFLPKSNERLPVFQAVDVRVDWSTTFDWFELDLYADLVNLNTVLGRPVEGTLYNFDFTQTAPRLGLPLIPSIGAKATF